MSDGEGVVVGVGCSRGCPAEELLGLVDGTLAALGLDAGAVRALATIDVRAEEPGVVSVAGAHGWPLRTHAASALAGVAVPTPSAVVAGAVGTPSVAEAAALLSAGPGARLLAAKRRTARATCAVAVRTSPSAREAGLTAGREGEGVRAPNVPRHPP